MFPLLAYARPDLPRDGGSDPRPSSSTPADANPSLLASAGAPAQKQPQISTEGVACTMLGFVLLTAVVLLIAAGLRLAILLRLATNGRRRP